MLLPASWENKDWATRSCQTFFSSYGLSVLVYPWNSGAEVFQWVSRYELFLFWKKSSFKIIIDLGGQKFRLMESFVLTFFKTLKSVNLFQFNGKKTKTWEISTSHVAESAVVSRFFPVKTVEKLLIQNILKFIVFIYWKRLLQSIKMLMPIRKLMNVCSSSLLGIISCNY